MSAACLSPEEWEKVWDIPEQPDLDWQLRILEIAVDPARVATVWRSCATWSSTRWMKWLVAEGYLTENLGRDGYDYPFPDVAHVITPKGRALLAHHVPSEW